MSNITPKLLRKLAILRSKTKQEYLTYPIDFNSLVRLNPLLA